MTDFEVAKAKALEAKKYQASQAKIYWVKTAQELADAYLDLFEENERSDDAINDLHEMMHHQITMMHHQITGLCVLEKKFRIAKEALQFYGESARYAPTKDGKPLPFDWTVYKDQGKKAREALAEIEVPTTDTKKNSSSIEGES